MFVLLSSAYSARYREDILRCLAAPIGSEIQFRYDKKWVAEGILEKIREKTFPPSAPAIVCWVDTEGTGHLTMIPVRSVSITRINLHGRSLSLILQMGEVHYADPASFTSEVFSLSGNASPKIKDGKAEGKYFFEITTVPPSLQTGDTITIWEESVSLLRDQAPFQQEPFFWVVIGMETEGQRIDTEKLATWPTEPISGPCDLLVYHYQPKQAAAVESKLSVSSNANLVSDNPSEVIIDSRYDLKRWRFEPAPDQYKTRPTWIRIRTNNKWDFDLSLTVKSSLGAGLFRSIVAGTLIAIPPTLAIVMQKDVCLHTEIIVGLISLVAGFFAAAAVVFGVNVFD